MRKLLLIPLLFCLCVTSFAAAQNDSLSMKELFAFAQQEPEKGYERILERYQQAIESGDAGKLLQATKYMARVGYLLADNPMSTYYMHKVDSLQKFLPEGEIDIEYQQFLIARAIARKQTRKAIQLLEDVQSIIDSKGDTATSIYYHTQAARAYTTFDDHAIALQNLYQAETLNEQLKDKRLQALIHSAYSAVHWEQRNLAEAYRYELKANKYYEETSQYRNLLPSYTNLMALALGLGQVENARKYAARYEALKAQYGTFIGTFTQELNQIFFYIQMQEFYKAKEQAIRTIQIAKKMEQDSSHAIYLLGISYRGLERYDLARPALEKAYRVADQMGHNGKRAFYAHALYQTYYWKEQYDPALQWYQTHINFRDSVYNEKKAKEIAVYEAKLEALEQKRKVEALEAKAEVDRQQKRLLWISLLLGSGLAAAIYYAQRQKSIRRQSLQASQLKEAQLQKEKLRQKLEFKEKELTSQVLHMTQKNAALLSLRQQIKNIDSAQVSKQINEMIRNIDRNLDDQDDWEQFMSSFTSIHSSFMKKLKKLTDTLTSNEIRLASLLRMNLSSGEIANMLHISMDGVKKARYRLRKKLKPEGDQTLQDFILGL